MRATYCVLVVGGGPASLARPSAKSRSATMPRDKTIRKLEEVRRLRRTGVDARAVVREDTAELVRLRAALDEIASGRVTGAHASRPPGRRGGLLPRLPAQPDDLRPPWLSLRP
jgi:hypothetical protein